MGKLKSEGLRRSKEELLGLDLMEVFREIFPDEYYAQFLEHGLRPDGRSKEAFRTTFANCGSVGTAYGSAIVRMGKTSVVAGVTASVKPCEGGRADAALPSVVVNAELLPLCCGRFRGGKPSVEQQSLCCMLNGLFASGVVDSSSLEVRDEEGDLLCQWVLIVDVYCINHDGSVFDAAVAAIVAALSSSTAPHLFLHGAQVPHSPPDSTTAQCLPLQ